MNFALELFLSALAMMATIMVIAQVVAKIFGGFGKEEE
jgi:hypothetical protein